MHVLISQIHSPVPSGGGNTRNSGFESTAFVAWVDGVRMGGGGALASFYTTAEQRSGVPVAFSVGALGPGRHSIRLRKATEPDWNGGSPAPNYVTFHGLQVNGSGSVKLVQPPPLPQRRLEFLGDSITAGYCNECRVNHTKEGHGEAFGKSWAAGIGDLLGAQVHVQAWSGLGLVHNCCGGNTTMPHIYSRTLATVNVDDTWDWKSWVPDGARAPASPPPPVRSVPTGPQR